MVQEHHASHLHYDFRLEVSGVLKSWAVPKGISTKPNEKHLAIQTEDHPIDYADFEGIIPEGEYGAGTVKIWDSGAYEQEGLEHHPEKTMLHSLKDGAVKFKLHGKKLKGTYSLVRFKQEKSKSEWLIFKVKEGEFLNAL